MSDRFPRGAPKAQVIRALSACGFQLVREGNHLALSRTNADGSKTLLTMPNHLVIKGGTLRRICSQSGIDREGFLSAYKKA